MSHSVYSGMADPQNGGPPQWQTQTCKFSGNLIFPKISGNISNSLEVIMSIILFKSLIFLAAIQTQCTKLKKKDQESCLSRTCLFYSITLQC